MPLQACFAAGAEECAWVSEWLLQPAMMGAPATSAATAAAINAFFSLRPMVPLRSGRSESGKRHGDRRAQLAGDYESQGGSWTHHFWESRKPHGRCTRPDRPRGAVPLEKQGLGYSSPSPPPPRSSNPSMEPTS